MITLVLDDHVGEDVELIQELQKLGVPDNLIQEYYNREQERRKANGERKNDGKEKA